MRAKKTVPTGVEKTLQDDDLIVSKTDLRGQITYGNRAFTQFSGYSETEYMGQAHNIVRHPDMPRAVFRLLWDLIASGQEVFAFVKNLCRDGSHYWVFANVTPSYDQHGQLIGYYSVRRKANPSAIATVEKIYKELIKIEKQHEGQQGIQAALHWLNESLKNQNSDYESFIMKIQSRQI